MKTNKFIIIFIIILLVFCNAYNVVSFKINKKGNTNNNPVFWAVLISVGEPERDLKNVNDLKNILRDKFLQGSRIIIFKREDIIMTSTFY